MTETDTSTAAVERACQYYEDWARVIRENSGAAVDADAMDEHCAMIRALAAERDEWARIVGQIALGVPLPDTIKATATVRDLIEYFQGLTAKVEALEADQAELTSIAYMRGQMDERDKERERCAQVAERWIVKDMWEQMGPSAMEQNAIARQITAAIRKGDE